MRALSSFFAPQNPLVITWRVESIDLLTLICKIGIMF